MIASSKVTERAEKRWDLIVERFRTACILHKQELNGESQQIIKQELPSLVKAWIQCLPSGLREDAKADLRDMFEKEQALVDQGFRLQRVFKETLTKHIIPQVEAKIAAKYRSIYVSRHERRVQERDADEHDSDWVSPSYGRTNGSNRSDGSHFDTGKAKVKITDVSDMIDAVQESESDDLTDTLLSLEQIVSKLSSEGIDPQMTAGHQF